MSSPTEDLLREVFAADAAAAPEPAALTDLVVHRVRRRRRVQGGAALAATAAVVGGILIIGPGPAEPHPIGALPALTRQVPPPFSATAPATVPAPENGASSGGSSVSDSCVQAYSPMAVAGRSFAFDGTVVAIGSARSNRPGVELPLSGVTFRVHQWFRGGSGSTAVVDLDTVRPPDVIAEPAVQAYRVGTRLLVSGEPRWGGRPMDAALAWSCGFTRPYDAQTAAAWAAATR